MIANDMEQKLRDACIKMVVNEKEQVTPVVLKPTEYSKEQFENALSLQPSFNSLVSSLVREKDYLLSICKSAAMSDPSFTGRLFQIAETVNDNSAFLLNVLRSDYMIDEVSDQLLQVELNTTCCAFGPQSDKLSQYFRDNGFPSVPENNFIDITADAFVTAHKNWSEHYGIDNAVIAIVVMENEKNIYDHKLLTSAIEARGIIVKRVYMSDIYEILPNGAIKHGGDIISAFYYRTGYMPSHYVNEMAWQNRVDMEQSIAIKVPNILTTLAGLKVVQQTLSDGDFVNNHNLKELLPTFVEQYNLGDDYENAMEALTREPDSFVLKPQREGGGNNIYAADVVPFIEKLPASNRSAYILMRLIKPKHIKNLHVLKFGDHQVIENAIQELGIYGVYLSGPGAETINKAAGWLIRTKSANSQEGAVSLGYGYLDCPLLI